MQPLRRLLRTHRRRLAVTYSALTVENLFDLLYPFAIGLTIDDLLAGRARGLVVFVAIWWLHTVVGYARQRYDTRVFSDIYTRAATELVLEQRAAGVDSGAVVARAGLAQELVAFLETDLTKAATALFGFVGSLVMLAVYDPLLAAGALLLVVPVGVANRLLARRSERLHAQVNTEFEREAALVAEADPDRVARHFRHLARRYVALSDAEAATWGILELFVIAFSVAAFVRTTDVTTEAGTVFATISYVWKYTASFEALPQLSQQVANLADIARRLERA